MKKIIIIIGLMVSILIICYFAFSTYDDKIEVSLARCVDGDTAYFDINGKVEKVRFLGIDTPESTNIVEEYGIEASRYTCDMLKSADSIYLEYDIDRYDKYERVLAWVFVDNNNLSKLLLSLGYAEVKYIYDDYKYIDELCEVQKEAYNNGLGIWNTYSYYDNYCYVNKNGV